MKVRFSSLGSIYSGLKMMVMPLRIILGVFFFAPDLDKLDPAAGCLFDVFIMPQVDWRA
jgi:hypothetical protein